MKMYSDADHDDFQNHPEIQKLFVYSAMEVYSRADQMKNVEANEYQMIARDWGFSFKDIECPVFLFSGKDDRACTPEMAEYLSEQIPTASAKYYKGKGHLLFFSIFEEILQALLSGKMTEQEDDEKDEGKKEESGDDEDPDDKKGKGKSKKTGKKHEGEDDQDKEKPKQDKRKKGKKQGDKSKKDKGAKEEAAGKSDQKDEQEEPAEEETKEKEEDDSK